MGRGEERLFSQLLKKLLEVVGLVTKKEVVKTHVLMEANPMVLLLFQIVPLVLLEETKLARMVEVVWTQVVVIQMEREELDAKVEEAVVPPVLLALLEEVKLARMVGVV